MASSLVDWVAKVFSSRGLQVTLQFTPVNRLGHNEDISGWGTCPLGLRGGLGAGGVRACENLSFDLKRWEAGDRPQQQERLKRRCTYGRY